NTFLRDIFSRDAQREMEQPYARGRYYHLYLNGLYFGLFQTQERTEARYAESYFGDDREDYDVIKVTPTTWPYIMEVTDGNDIAWSEIYDLCEAGFDSNEDYFKLEGKDKNGNPVKNTKVLVDIDNLIDYMVLIFYTGNFDAPVSSFGSNDMPNNFYAIYNRKDKGKGFIICAHDSEHSLMIDPVYVGEGLYENRVNIADRTDWLKMEVNDYLDFHPQWLHYKLSDVEEYRVRFSDRAARLLNEGGVFSPGRAAELFIKRAGEIDTAIIAESARWGDAKLSPSRTKDDDWLPEVNNVLNVFFPQRSGIVIQQLKDADLYSDVIPPRISKSNTVITDREYYFSDAFEITIENQNSSGDIYYTLDGSDPRKIGGLVSENALHSAGDFTLDITSSTILKSRITINDDWSALCHINFYSSDEDYTYLKVTELHYHPPDKIEGVDTISGADFEFIEFKNTGNEAIDISGLKLDSAVSFTIPQNTILAPGGFYVIASKPEEFYNNYGMVPSGNYSRHFANSSEFVLLSDKEDNEILSFTYHDESPWPVIADGGGYSIVSADINPDTDPDTHEYWRASMFVGGSPFADDTSTISDIEDNEIFTNNETDNNIYIYPNPAGSYLNIRFYSYIGIEDGYLQLYSDDGRIVYNSRGIKDFMTIDLDALNISSGVYFLRIVTDKVSQVERVIYIDK
ncbi:MAG: CotH kinase family protein, partial [Bacteroidales bacterium]